MKWYKHISDSIDDPFIFELMRRFGGDGYLVFFGILEIYAREFQTELDWKLSTTQAYLKQKLCKRQATLILKSLEFIKNSGKWNIELNGENIIIFIPKFRELLDESTLKKLREYEKSFRNASGIIPKTEGTDEDKDKDKEEDIVVVSDANHDCPHLKIVSLYHDHLPALPRVRQWTEKRQKWLRARWNEDPDRQNLEWWEAFFKYIATCPHLIGVNDRNWTADLEWICNSTNFVKIIEGRYEKK
jgi:hypothetical protein